MTPPRATLVVTPQSDLASPPPMLFEYPEPASRPLQTQSYNGMAGIVSVSTSVEMTPQSIGFDSSSESLYSIRMNRERKGFEAGMV